MYSWCLRSDLTCWFAPCEYVQAILMLNPEQQKLVVDSIVWGFKHTDRNIAEIGLEILHDLLMVRTTRVPSVHGVCKCLAQTFLWLAMSPLWYEQHVQRNTAISTPFYVAYLHDLISDLFGVMTDRYALSPRLQ